MSKTPGHTVSPYSRHLLAALLVPLTLPPTTVQPFCLAFLARCLTDSLRTLRAPESAHTKATTPPKTKAAGPLPAPCWLCAHKPQSDQTHQQNRITSQSQLKLKKTGFVDSPYEPFFKHSA